MVSVERFFDLLFFVLVSFVSTVLVWIFLILNVELFEAELICHSDKEEDVVEKESIDSMELSIFISVSVRFWLTVVISFLSRNYSVIQKNP